MIKDNKHSSKFQWLINERTARRACAVRREEDGSKVTCLDALFSASVRVLGDLPAYLGVAGLEAPARVVR